MRGRELTLRPKVRQKVEDEGIAHRHRFHVELRGAARAVELAQRLPDRVSTLVRLKDDAILRIALIDEGLLLPIDTKVAELLATQTLHHACTIGPLDHVEVLL